MEPVIVNRSYEPIETIPKPWGSSSVYFKATPKKPFPDFLWLQGFFSYIEGQYPNYGDFGDALFLFRQELQQLKEPLAIKINHFEPGQGTSRQYHFNRRELYLGLKEKVEVSKGPVPYGERGWEQLSKTTLKPGQIKYQRFLKYWWETLGKKILLDYMIVIIEIKYRY